MLVATQNRNYEIGSLLLDKGANPNLANKGGWTPLYVAVDNRNIEAGDYPVPKPDLDHFDYIKRLLAHSADKSVNAQMKEPTERRTVRTRVPGSEVGKTAFLRAVESSDLAVMRLLLANGADPLMTTKFHVDALQLASGLNWKEGMSYEWSEQANVEAVKLLLDMGFDPNAQADNGRTALHGAAMKGRTAVIQLLVDAGAKLDTRDYGMSRYANGRLTEHSWQPVDYTDGMVTIDGQTLTVRPEAGLLLRKLMKEAGLYVPAPNRTLETVCITAVCK